MYHTNGILSQVLLGDVGVNLWLTSCMIFAGHGQSKVTLVIDYGIQSQD